MCYFKGTSQPSRNKVAFDYEYADSSVPERVSSTSIYIHLLTELQLKFIYVKITITTSYCQDDPLKINWPTYFTSHHHTSEEQFSDFLKYLENNCLLRETRRIEVTYFSPALFFATGSMTYTRLFHIERVTSILLTRLDNLSTLKLFFFFLKEL